MHAWRRILTGLPFSVDASGRATLGNCTERVVRWALELRRLGRGDVAFAAVGEWPGDDIADCAKVDHCADGVEADVAAWLKTASADREEFEVGAWSGLPGEEWTLAAQASEMDLLIVPGTASDAGIPTDAATWPARAGCPVWFVGRETDSLSGEPPLVLCLDDFSEDAEEALRVAIRLSQVWSARLLVGHAMEANEPPTTEREEEIRRMAFARLSRNDFRCLAQGANFVSHHGEVEELIREVGTSQAPNLVIRTVTGDEIIEGELFGGAHGLLWPRMNSHDE